MLLKLIDRACFWWVRRRANGMPAVDISSYPDNEWNRGYYHGIQSACETVFTHETFSGESPSAETIKKLLRIQYEYAQDFLNQKEPRNDAGR